LFSYIFYQDRWNIVQELLANLLLRSYLVIKSYMPDFVEKVGFHQLYRAQR